MESYLREPLSTEQLGVESLGEPRPLQEIMDDLITYSPRLMHSLSAADAESQRAAFLSGQIVEPKRDYARLHTIDFDEADRRLEALGAELKVYERAETPGREHDYRPYTTYVAQQRKVNELLRCAAIITGDASDDEKIVAEQRYTDLNNELYGGVDVGTYQTILASKVRAIEVNPQDQAAVRMLAELKAMLPSEVLDNQTEPYHPSAETMEMVHEVATHLYENFLYEEVDGQLVDYIPDRAEPYTSLEIRDILERIVHGAFRDADYENNGADSAADWNVERVKKTGLRVEQFMRSVQVSETMKASADKLRDLVVHELGFHLLRAVRGSETDTLLMAIGFPDYGDAEEGGAMVMQQARAGKFNLPGAGHYITIGFMRAGHGVRETFEMKWRLAALEQYRLGTDIDEPTVEAAQGSAYTGVMRIACGTDKLPLLKDLSYHNGAKVMWQFFEKYADDELMLNLALLGKIDPTNPDHVRAALETRSIH